MDFAGQRRTVATVKTRFVSWNVALPYPGSSLLASVEVRQAGRCSRRFVRARPSHGVTAEPFAVKMGTVKSSWVPAQRSGRTPGVVIVARREQSFFPGPGHEAKAVPPFGVGLFIDTLCARIWKNPQVNFTGGT